VVHADVAITGGGQLFDGALQHFQFCAGLGSSLLLIRRCGMKRSGRCA
jgi:hypothetical protein